MPLILSVRLQALADRVPRGEAVADIGCDHGRLSVCLAQKGCKVVACDISEPSLAKARALRERAGVSGMETRLSDGFSALRPGEAHTAVISGMGGATVAQILRAALPGQVERLLLMPHGEVFRVYEALADGGYAVTDEDIIWDAGRPYRLLEAHPGHMRPPEDEFERQFGTVLPAKRPREWKPVLEREIRLRQAALAARARAGLPAEPQEEAYLDRCREVLACMKD
ncbi:MAG: class I SAM-dependent methyltransferase [Eubacteriales bacterium]|nr:class I SAM-dependent methyltransferase [Eubacteriales bacterium]